MDRRQAASIVNEHAEEIRARGVTQLALFGSLARGDAGNQSDVDVVVDIEPGRKFSLIDLASLRVFLSDILGCEADVVIREDLRPRFREEIERDTVRIL
jgi:hypothetical protein